MAASAESPAYLRGIETGALPAAAGGQQESPAYLRGIETQAAAHFNASCAGLQPT